MEVWNNCSGQLRLGCVRTVPTLNARYELCYETCYELCYMTVISVQVDAAMDIWSLRFDQSSFKVGLECWQHNLDEKAHHMHTEQTGTRCLSGGMMSTC